MKLSTVASALGQSEKGTFGAAVQNQARFKDILKDKMAQKSAPSETGFLIKETLRMWENDQAAYGRLIRDAFKNRVYNPQNLLILQHQAGTLMIRQQFFAKSVELLSNGAKTLTQMPV